MVHTQTAKVYFYPGGIDVGQGLTSTCGGLGTEQYGSWKPGVYFIPRKNVYITDARNQQLEIPEITASGTATCNIYVKTTPASDKYVAAGLIESNQLFQITKTTPINGHYQIYYKQGLYYVNAKYVNLRQSDENKPVMQYDAVVTADNPVNITSEANASSSVEGIVKKDAKLQVVKKNYGNGYSQVWFNSKKCYIPTKNLTGFEKYMSFSDIKELGKPKGKLVLNAAWSGWGNTAYTAEALKILKKYHMNPYSYKVEQKIKAINGSYHMEDGDCATVLLCMESINIVIIQKTSRITRKRQRYTKYCIKEKYATPWIWGMKQLTIIPEINIQKR